MSMLASVARWRESCWVGAVLAFFGAIFGAFVARVLVAFLATTVMPVLRSVTVGAWWSSAVRGLQGLLGLALLLCALGLCVGLAG